MSTVYVMIQFRDRFRAAEFSMRLLTMLAIAFVTRVAVPALQASGGSRVECRFGHR